MTMPPGVRKSVLAAHLVFSVGWIGAVSAYFAIAVAGATGQDSQTVRAAWIAMDLAGWYVIVPLALSAWVSGLVMALGTRWGLFQHYWVLFSLALTTFAVVILVLHMLEVSSEADVAREAGDARVSAVGGDFLLHPGVGLVLLVVIEVVNVFKPWGMTRYGLRSRGERCRRPVLYSSHLEHRSAVEEAE